ncbi:MAG: transglutaminase domain-containing protein [bacterium]|nr:transglutaminase domain-containing protein [bacterium]
MNKEILDHYLATSLFTDLGLYKEAVRKLPDDIKELGLLVRKNLVHPSTIYFGNTNTNEDLRFGDMTEMPWWRQREDDNLATAVAMVAELYRRDKRGFVNDRKVTDKLVVSCRHTSLVMAAILKAKGIPARVRAGFASYFEQTEFGDVSDDHYINQYFHEKENRWVTIDVDGCMSIKDGFTFDPFDMPDGTFHFSAKAWLDIREGKQDPNYFMNKPERGAIVVVWALMHDFHCLMNNEIIYLHYTVLESFERFGKITEEELKKLDNLAKLILNPDENFSELKKLWEENKEFRLLKGGLL